MHSFRILAGLLPAVALAACMDSNPVSGPTNPSEVTAVTARGAMLAREVCGSCHGSNFQGGTVGDVECPALTVVKNYTFAQFDALLTTSAERDGATANGYMTVTQSLAPADREALHQYLKNYYDQ
ncbi:MAG: c-type cytochrome [Gemmatimonadaceae bacterium]|jgi:mono/diheme cytochrome c family protein